MANEGKIWFSAKIKAVIYFRKLTITLDKNKTAVFRICF